MEPVETFEHAGVTVEIVYDDDPYGPQENDNAGTIYSWTRDFDGDKSIHQPDTISGRPYELADSTWELTGQEATDALNAYFAENYKAALTIPLRFSDYGSSGARIYDTDAEDANAAICFTQEEIDTEWKEDGVEGARTYAEARINELDQYMQGLVFGIVIRHPETHEVMESVWGFIGDPDSEWIQSEARAMAEGVAEDIARERAEALRWAARGVVTVG